MKSIAHNSIYIRLSVLIAVLCLIIMAYAGVGLYISYTDYQQAHRLTTVQDVTQYFSDGLKNFIFVRDRMSIVLSKEEPVSPENSLFLMDRWAAADQSFEAGFAAMQTLFPEETQALRTAYAKIEELRIAMNAEATKESSQRDADDRVLWFDSTTDFIHTVIQKIYIIRQLASNNSSISNLFKVVVDSLHFRSIVGIRATMITSVIALGQAPDREEAESLFVLTGAEQQLWSELENAIAIIESDSLTAVFRHVAALYYQQYRPEQERLLALANSGQLFAGEDEELANLTVPALDSILQLGDEAARGIQGEILNHSQQALRGLLTGIITLFVSLVIVIFLPIYIKKGLLRPFSNIMQTLENISEGKMDDQIRYLKREDGIGKLARGTEMLKNSIIREQALKQELEQTVLQLEELSIKDSLTGLYNRRYTAKRLEELASLFKRSHRAFSVILCDIDNFKSINDRYSHECGDKVLVHVSALLSSHCRETDTLARWGGEEFLFLLPDTDMQGARELAERARAGLASAEYECDILHLHLTMTFGVAEYSQPEGIQGTIKQADRALLKGKENGRNQVVLPEG